MTTPSVDASSTPSPNCSVDTVKSSALPSDIEIHIWCAEDDNIRLYPQHEEKVRAGYANIRKYALQLLSEGFSEEKVYSIINTDIKMFRVVLAKELESHAAYEQNHTATTERFKHCISVFESVDSSEVTTILGGVIGTGAGSLAGSKIGASIHRSLKEKAAARAIANGGAAWRAYNKIHDAQTYHFWVSRMTNDPRNADIKAQAKEYLEQASVDRKQITIQRKTTEIQAQEALAKLARPPRAGKFFGGAVGGAVGGIAGASAGFAIGSAIDHGSHLLADKLSSLMIDGAEAAYKECANNGVNPVMIP